MNEEITTVTDYISDRTAVGEMIDHSRVYHPMTDLHTWCLENQYLICPEIMHLAEYLSKESYRD